MKKKNLILSLTAGLLFANTSFAGDPLTEKDERIMKSINYIEDDSDFELGFDTADWLPEGFDPYEIYVNLDTIIFIEEEVIDGFVSKKYLPADFDAYSYPTGVEAMNFIEENDQVELDFATRDYLPEGFDPFKK